MRAKDLTDEDLVTLGFYIDPEDDEGWLKSIIRRPDPITFTKETMYCILEFALGRPFIEVPTALNVNCNIYRAVYRWRLEKGY